MSMQQTCKGENPTLQRRVSIGECQAVCCDCRLLADETDNDRSIFGCLERFGQVL
jgi:hypothetical protein